MRQMFRKEKAALVLIVLSNVLFDALLLVIRRISPPALTDLMGQRALCAYTLRGVDPYPQIGIEPPLLPDVGSIPAFFGTSPWGLTLSNIFYPAFLPLELARHYFLALNVMILLATAFVFYDASKKISARLGRITIALFALPAPFLLTLWYENAGGAICCLLLICCVVCERRPFLTGILLSFAMIKPQTALPFCILFLFRGQWKVLLTAAAIDVTAWLGASAQTGTAPLTLLIEMMNANIGGGMMFSGLMSLIVDDTMQSIRLSMLVGVLFLIVMHRCTTEKNFLSMYPACVTASFWSYSTGNEIFILVLPALCCFQLMLQLKRLRFLATGIIFYSALMMLQLAAMSCLTFALDTRIITACVTLRVCFCFVFIAIALYIAQRDIDRLAP